MAKNKKTKVISSRDILSSKINPDVEGIKLLQKQGLNTNPAGMPPMVGDQYIGQSRNDIVDPTGRLLNSITGVQDVPDWTQVPIQDSVIGQMLNQAKNNFLFSLNKRAK